MKISVITFKDNILDILDARRQFKYDHIEVYAPAEKERAFRKQAKGSDVRIKFLHELMYGNDILVFIGCTTDFIQNNITKGKEVLMTNDKVIAVGAKEVLGPYMIGGVSYFKFKPLQILTKPIEVKSEIKIEPVKIEIPIEVSIEKIVEVGPIKAIVEEPKKEEIVIKAEAPIEPPVAEVKKILPKRGRR